MPLIPFSANTRVSGLDAGGRSSGARVPWTPCSSSCNGHCRRPPLRKAVERVSRAGSTPLAVLADGKLIGLIELKDIVKPGIRERFRRTAPHGHQAPSWSPATTSITAAAIATEAGVDDFIAEATPQDKLAYIRKVTSRRPPGRHVR